VQARCAVPLTYTSAETWSPEPCLYVDCTIWGTLTNILPTTRILSGSATFRGSSCRHFSISSVCREFRTSRMPRSQDTCRPMSASRVDLRTAQRVLIACVNMCKEPEDVELPAPEPQ